MTQRLSHLLSIVVFVLAMTFATIPAVSAVGPALPNRAQHDASGSGESAVLACRMSFHVAETDAIETAVPHGITTAMLVVEQDSGDRFILAGASVPVRAAPVSGVATTGCATPA